MISMKPVGVAGDSSGKTCSFWKGERERKRLASLFLQPLDVMSRALTVLLTPSSHKENDEEQHSENRKPERKN